MDRLSGFITSKYFRQKDQQWPWKALLVLHHVMIYEKVLRSRIDFTSLSCLRRAWGGREWGWGWESIH